MNAALTRFVLVLAFASLVPVAAAADQPKRPITAQDLWAVKRVGAPALSPDGRQAAYSVQEWSIEKNKPTAALWLTDVASATSRRLTAGTGSDTAPAWSPDGSRIAFVGKRGEDEMAALYVIAVGGGEAEKLVELPYGVAVPAWLPDGKGIVFATQVIPELSGSLAKADLAAMKKEAKRRKDSKMTAYASEYRQYRWFDRNLTDNLANRLLRIDVASKALTELTPKYDRLFQPSGEVRFDVAPDGRHIALALNSTPPPYANQPNLDIVLVPTDGSGAFANLTVDNPYSDDNPRFAPDGRSVLYTRVATANSQGELRRLWQHRLAEKRNVPMASSVDLSIDNPGFTGDGNSLVFLAEQQGRVPLFRLNPDGSGTPSVLFGEGSSTALDVQGQQAVFLNEHTGRPAELFAMDLRGGPARQLTRFNEALFAGLDLGKVESHEFPGAGGDTVQMWVIYPPGFDPKKKYPLVQLLHGGPHTMVRDAFSPRWNSHVFASPGYIVAWVNRHGSTGFGEAFARSINGAWGDKPTEDVLKANDYLFATIPAIDRDNVAAAGASYGGYLATWLLGHTKAFKTLVNHAGVSDLMGQYGADITTYGFTREVLGGTPWDSPEAMQRNNPVAYAANFSTPMLITHGEKDYRVPYGQGIALYGILQTMRVPSRLVVFPDENHWILSPQNSIYWNYEVQNWLARYIGGKPMAKPEFKAAE
ncbi:alpha/beta hydrolase family protein [Thermomonas carbonis]|uniref:S9 family peptidase n=1 Tax=Thermomonas carbonis TaxID=1463158 RepID=A0A7G9SMH5_9GAMM|nr:S9 family peptidase [Thermomonas carbonis]QNN69050.1 S9 family peptidase [Thermomonas carbonis]GHC07097.1 peptidase S9 [Thermomonas carbonis]